LVASTRILAIETSCDETAAAVVEDGRYILSAVVASQVELHSQYGGIFPEMASRAHLEAIVPVVDQAMRDSHLGYGDVDAVAVTHGPGLAGSLLVGVNAAKGIALAHGLPLLAVNHLEAHIYAHWLQVTEEDASRLDGTWDTGFPYLALLVSGGHTELILMQDHGDYEFLGGTLDDAAGEAFDKVGRILGLSYPGGPAIEKAALRGRSGQFTMPRAWLEGTYDFSFSGPKTAMLRVVQEYSDTPTGQLQADLASAFQEAVIDVLSSKAVKAAQDRGAKAILLCGGVSANRALRNVTTERSPFPVYFPARALCTDNAVMVGACAYRQLVAGQVVGWDVDVVPGLRLA
jgi:N6-L-threonylcarbamoyladenine synthase